MARRVRTWFREIPRDTREALALLKGVSSTECLEILRDEKVTIVTPISEIRRIAKVVSRKYRVPVRMSKKEFEDEPSADALFSHGDGVIYWHPVLQYYSPKYVREVLEHEADHYGVWKRRQ